MEEAYKAITSPAWWVGVVIVGLLINLAAAYLKPGLDQAASSVSLRWATRTEEQRRQRLRRIERLRGDINAQLLASFAELRAGMWSIILFIIFTFVELFGYMHFPVFDKSLTYIFMHVSGMLVFYVGLRYLLDFVGMASEIREAQRSEETR